MKLVFILTGTTVGGAQIVLHGLLTRLSPEFKPHVISMNLVGEIGEKIRALGTPVESLNMRPGIPDPVVLMRLIRRLPYLKPDLVHTWMYHADLMGGVAAWLARVPALAWCIRNSDLASAGNKNLTGYTPEKMIVVPNGCDMAQFKLTPTRGCPCGRNSCH